MSEDDSLLRLLAAADTLSEFLAMADKRDVPTDAQVAALRRHVWGEDVPSERVRRILDRERQRLHESEPVASTARPPRYMDLGDLELVSEYEFAHLLAEVLRRVEGEATLMTGLGEHGVDVVWERADETVGIHAKANDLTDPVEAPVVQAVRTGVTRVGSDDAIDVPAVVTTSRYTAEASNVATELGVRLYDRSALERWVAEARLDGATMGEILDTI